MPSGVSQGAALPAFSARAVFSNAIFAKFGMRLILPASFVIAGLVPAIHVLFSQKDVDTRAKPGHDGFNDENIIALYDGHSTAPLSQSWSGCWWLTMPLSFSDP